MYLAKIEASLKDNPKMFWKYHKSILHHRSSLNPIITFNNRTAKSPKEKAELFNTYFCSVLRAAQTAMNHDAFISLVTSSSQPSDITISEKEVATHLCNLDISKVTGPDGIPGRILKQCSTIIAPSLRSLSNHSRHFGTDPFDWKAANVTPVLKKEKKEPASNYRPISLLSIISKVLERCICAGSVATCVGVNSFGTASKWSPVISGVSQGSISGPMLFLLFINDLPDVIPQATSTGLYTRTTRSYTEL